ncbi:dynamin family protein [Aliarcobacter butzleri]|uniref:dynamin family protein n=1 Tax=Aliarcobacter butzleri TaxID=28197 RepID=UPI0021B4E807|nr:dynamin family protein [Aliarcobacter butzleri]MCT7574459.1 dynamin family protein [Aliarcobacter butzleri]
MNYLNTKNNLLNSTKEFINLLENPILEAHKNSNKSINSFNTEIQNELLFKVLCLGEFNAGKSTFLNNFFIKEDILPTGGVPTTAKITTIKYGEEKELITVDENGKQNIHKDNLHDVLKSVVSVKGEDLNKVNEVILTMPSDILKDGVVIIDTAGLNDSVKERSLITVDYVEQADAVIFLLRAGQPWSKSEKEFLEEKIFSKKNLDKVFFVVNLWDTVKEEEKKEVLEYLKDEIGKSLQKNSSNDRNIKDIEIFPISAKTGENFDNLKEKLFDYLSMKKSEEILNQKIKTFQTYLDETLTFLNTNKEELSKSDKELEKEKNNINENKRKFEKEKIELESKIKILIEGEYSKFLEDLESEYENTKENIIEKLSTKLYREENSVENRNHSIQLMLREVNTKVSSSFNKKYEKFQNSINEILFKEKCILKLKTSNILDKNLLFEENDNTYISKLSNRRALNENIVATIGAGGVASLVGGIGLASLPTTVATQGAFASAWTWLFGGTTAVAGASASTLLAFAGGGVTLLSIPLYMYLRDKSKSKENINIETIIEDIERLIDENIKGIMEKLYEQKSDIIGLILGNIENDIINSYNNEIKNYETLISIKGSVEEYEKLDMLIEEIKKLKVN